MNPAVFAVGHFAAVVFSVGVVANAPPVPASDHGGATVASKKKAGVATGKGRERGKLGPILPTSGSDATSAGSLREPRGPCPAHMVPVGTTFCIDAYEASLVRVHKNGAEEPHSPFHRIAPGVRVRAVSLPSVYPQGYISGVQAKQACLASGKRLCKPAEWQTACMGSKKTLFPYGKDRKSQVCNDYGKSSLQRIHVELTDLVSDKEQWKLADFFDPRLNQLPHTLARTGAHPGCVNDYGVFDMVGNLHEWVDDPAGTFQGGYYLDTKKNMDGCYYRTTAHEFSHLDYSTGFRCCADLPEVSP